MNEINRPIISIITVVYNNLTGIEETILSVVNQSYKNIEYIIIDGNSNDGTTEVIKKYTNYIDVFISEPDNGIYDAMNKGIDLATGDYIIFMNSSDIFYNYEVISEVFCDLTRTHDIIFGDTCADYGTYNKIVKASYPKQNNPMSFGHQAVFVKTPILKKNRFDTNYKICSDKNQFIQIFKYQPSYKYYNITISKIAAFGISNENRIATLKEIKTIYKKNNISSNLALNMSLLRGKCISLIESIIGVNKINNLRRLLN
jgi:glycosyltransferase involved in cell wall biosynthesis